MDNNRIAIRIIVAGKRSKIKKAKIPYIKANKYSMENILSQVT